MILDSDERARRSDITLVTERLLLRELRIEDAEAAHRYESDPNVVRFQSNGVRTLEESRDYIARIIEASCASPRLVFDLGLCLRETEAYVGRVGFAVKSAVHREAMLWYVIDPSHGGRGLVHEACSRLLDFAFGELSLHRAYVDVDPRNEASVRVAERLGMVREGVLRENAWLKGEWTHSMILAVLEREWSARREK